MHSLRSASALIAMICVLSGCQPSGTVAASKAASTPITPSTAPATASLTGTTSKPAVWSQLLEAAKHEGALTVYGAGPDPAAAEEAFGKLFPDIHVDSRIPGAQIATTIVAERAAGKFLADVLFSGGPNIIALKSLGALAPMPPALVLPEVVDASAWQDHHLWWIDASEPYTTLAFVGRVQEVASYNAMLVDPKQIKSYWDLLDPKWKGKMVLADPRQAAQGSTFFAFVYKHPELGPPYMERLLSEMNITLSADHRQMMDWVAQGRFPIGLSISRPLILQAIDQGLPVNIMPGDQFKEGAPLTAGGGVLGLADRAPHPNAAKVFLNWLLSKDGQATWQKLIRENSLRTDINKAGIPGFNIPKPGVKYVNTSSEEHIQIGAEAAKLVDQLLQAAKS